MATASPSSMSETPSPLAALESAKLAIETAFISDEATALQRLIDNFPIDQGERSRIEALAAAIVAQSRASKQEQGSLDAFLAEFGLSNQEGVALMCLAEALLRVPDGETRDDLIAEKILSGDWGAHKGRSESMFVNASTWALMLTGRVIELDRDITKSSTAWLGKLVSRSGEPVIRAAITQAMKIMGRQFVFGRNIKDALARQKKEDTSTRTMSFDMLGEGARTQAAADRYQKLYLDAIAAVGSAEASTPGDIHDKSSVSIKLSALHPRYDERRRARVLRELTPRLLELAEAAKAHDIQMTIDAEEADRLELQLDLLAELASAPSLAGWNGLGLAVQAYQKRAPFVIDWLIALGRRTGRVIPVRLVKGAYWDTEVKNSQVMGYDDYPVWTRKPATDVCYLYTAHRMLRAGDALYPQFATHNANTIAAIHTMAKTLEDEGTLVRYEFQRLHGMGTLLYRAAGKALGATLKTRTYAPVGQHEDLLPYLVRRLLENGANSSFINRFMDEDVPVETIAQDPLTAFLPPKALRHSKIPTPANLFGHERRNSKGINLSYSTHTKPLMKALDEMASTRWSAHSIVAGLDVQGTEQPIFNPANHEDCVGSVTSPADNAWDNILDTAFTAAHTAQKSWNRLGGSGRAEVLRACADALEAASVELTSLLIREAGKTHDDCIAEIREAVDFCRYYATEAEAKFTRAMRLPGPTGEENWLSLSGRGVFVCISPWNFPLAIFTGQIMAALAAGCGVVAKPADQTPMIASLAVKLFIKAGVPADLLHLVIGGPALGAKLVSHKGTSGVAFTGSTATARKINMALAERDGPILPLIAETGGQNAMVVDSTALTEQVVDDALLSAFGSAGQRCSALRVLYVQDVVADRVIAMLKEALAERVIGNPADLVTDIGPIIDKAALTRLQEHVADMEKRGKLIAKGTLADGTPQGTYLVPHIFEIDHIDQIGGEKFGPILHVIRFSAKNIAGVISEITSTGYGLTFGVHSRLEDRWAQLFGASEAGNNYINRNITGAVVGVQPFGGSGLSGTGPKAGGPHYVLRFAHERTLTVNTAAVGGNADLFSLDEGE